MCYEAQNVYAAKRTVIANTAFLILSGTCGDSYHLSCPEGACGDHTYRSSHRGKFGYPTQGQVHAIDISGSLTTLSQFESWFRREVRAGRAKGVKYINVLGRQWNLQTWENYNLMQAGRLSPRYSEDYSHVHISFENGNIDSDIVQRFVDFHYGRVAEDDMTPLELLNYKLSSTSIGTHSVADLLKAAYEAKALATKLQTEVDELKTTLQDLPKIIWNFQIASSAFPTPLAAADLIKRAYLADQKADAIKAELDELKNSLNTP